MANGASQGATGPEEEDLDANGDAGRSHMNMSHNQIGGATPD
jgi:hypothetical protein